MGDTLDPEWHEVPDYPGYAVSVSGSVRGPRGRLLKPGTDRSGYRRVCVYMPDGSRRAVAVHVLVLLTFVGPRPAGTETRHLNGTRSDNAQSNLAYGTRAENALDKVRHGTSSKVVERWTAKLTLAAAVAIRERYAAGESKRGLARAYRVDPATIRRIVRLHNWRGIRP